MFKQQQEAVKTGDQFLSSGREKSTWTVELVFTDANKIPHARLRQNDNPTIQRTLACSVLIRSDQFQKMALVDA